MKVAVYLASMMPENKNFIDKTIELGEYLGKNKHTLVYGGANTGLMGLIADSVLKENGQVIGVLTNIKLILDRRKPGLTEYIETENMADRRIKMIEISDLYIALPGGPGTLDEFSEIMDFIRIKTFNKKLIIYNIDGYYDDIKNQIDKYYSYGFIEKGDMDNVIFCKNIEEVKKVFEK